MFRKLTELNTGSSPPKEGDLFKVVELHGRRFEIRYGYYEEIDRTHDPTEVYPDFLKNPVYTEDGYPFITYMQEGCKYYQKRDNDDDNDCYSCIHMERGQELIGVCRCKSRRKNE
ncbi:MAG: hypothetical protein J6V80_04465 [Clostridia bacterium]|nr:hypothetical protein [Clostridia bacterium]